VIYDDQVAGYLVLDTWSRSVPPNISSFYVSRALNITIYSAIRFTQRQEPHKPERPTGVTLSRDLSFRWV